MCTFFYLVMTVQKSHTVPLYHWPVQSDCAPFHGDCVPEYNTVVSLSLAWWPFQPPDVHKPDSRRCITITNTRIIFISCFVDFMYCNFFISNYPCCADRPQCMGAWMIAALACVRRIALVVGISASGSECPSGLWSHAVSALHLRDRSKIMIWGEFLYTCVM
jgi:hypothetical protein